MVFFVIDRLLAYHTLVSLGFSELKGNLKTEYPLPDFRIALIARLIFCL